MESEMSSAKNIDASKVKNTKSSSNRTTTGEILLVSQVSLANSSGSNNNPNNNNSPKMGSRRIFTPQFKLQVLESYRNDSDCKGNQRATARKYNIHRRQIQKWLQCESSLRSSVANINHNTVKHQFHNISIQQQSQKLAIPSNSLVSGSYGSNHQHSAHLSVDSASQMSISSLATGVGASSSQTQGVFAPANLATVVAAAALSGATMAITSAASSTSTSAPIKAVELSPSAVASANRNTSATMSPLLHHPHYGIPPYTHTPAGIPRSVPILTHHISHSQQQLHQHTQLLHQSYQYHNLAYTQTLAHQPEKQQSSYLSSVSLPTINALSTAASASTPNGYAVKKIEQTDESDALQLRIKSSSEVLSEINGYVYNKEHKNSYAECSKSTEIACSNNVNEPLTVYELKNDGYPLVFPIGPIDLSLRRRPQAKTELLTNIKSNIHSCETKHSEMLRKRKVANTSKTADELKCEFPEKQAKLAHSQNEKTHNNITYNITQFCQEHSPNTENCKEEDDTEIEIEVGTEEEIQPSKPVKLFKPYLLDCYNENDNTFNSGIKCTENELTESNEKSSWTSYKASVSPIHCFSDIPAESYRENTFQVTVRNNYLSTHDSSNFLEEIITGSPKSAFIPATPVPTLSPTTFQCPKGSPASSGYESSTSTYSESSLSSRSETHAYGQTYSINLQMHSIYNDNIVCHPAKHVQRWLDNKESNPLTTNPSIALFV